jgi:hypothetical protein
VRRKRMNRTSRLEPSTLVTTNCHSQATVQ